MNDVEHGDDFECDEDNLQDEVEDDEESNGFMDNVSKLLD